MVQSIDGAVFAGMLIHASASLNAEKQKINELNVFPVPDGDTGTNMSLTIGTAASELAAKKPTTIGQATALTASAMLRGARGNSGVILSLIFRGFSKAMKDKETMDGIDLADGINAGVIAAYRAVMKPAEGTVLTVSRLAGDRAGRAAEENTGFEYVLESAIDRAREALADTVEQNPVLKKAGVVDAGGMGFVTILQGMLDELRGVPMPDGHDHAEVKEAADFATVGDEEITFTYDTVYIVRKSSPDVDLEPYRAWLESIGDSLVIGEDDEVFKVHVHTKEPWKVIQYAQQYGEFVTFKMENMTIQHNEKLLKEMPIEGKGVKVSSDIKPEPLKHSKIQVIAVAPSPEIGKLFKDLGVAGIITGGQTMNPSAQDFVDKLDYVNADDVIIFPNNSNVIMTAEQAAGMYTKSKVHVMHSKSVVEAYSAMKMADIAGASVEENIQIMEEQMKSVVSMQISKSIRDSKNNGMTIRKNDFIGIMGGKIVSHDRTIMKAVQKMVKNVPNMDEKSIITVFYGKNATEKMKVDLKKLLERLCPMMDIYEIDGGQPVYHFTIAFE